MAPKPGLNSAQNKTNEFSVRTAATKKTYVLLHSKKNHARVLQKVGRSSESSPQCSQSIAVQGHINIREGTDKRQRHDQDGTRRVVKPETIHWEQEVSVCQIHDRRT